MKKVKKIASFKQRAYLVPSLITVTSLFSGYLSIISSIKGNYDHAIKYILLAAILDALDGGVARKLNAASDFGKEFDSLCDLVAFGVAPAVLIWEWCLKSAFNEFGVLATFLFIAGGATRLARYNVTSTSEPKSYFIGLPIPAAAGCLSSVVYGFPEGISDFLSGIILIYTIALGGLMVSTFKFPSIKRLRVSQIDPRKFFLLLSFLVALIWVFDRLSIFLAFLSYVIFALTPRVKGYFINSQSKVVEETSGKVQEK